MKLKIITIFIFLTNIVSAQSDTYKTYFIKEFRITGYRDTVDNNFLIKKKFTYKDLNRVMIAADTFEFKSSNNKNIYRLSPKEIKKISIRDGNYLLPAAGYSALAGFGLGFLLGTVAKGKGEGHPSYSFGGTRFGLGLGFVLALTFGVIGGLFGSGTPHYIDFNLTKNGMFDNDTELRKIINKYSGK